MTRGLNRRQIGLSEAMVEAYGETVWDLSHNVQVRIGDPIRMLDWEQIELQRPGTGMSDRQIAEKIGLTRDQVTHIRLLLEHRRFQRDHYHRLYQLGGGRRFRAERFEDAKAHQPLSDAAMALREALDFDPRDVDRYLRTGLWGSATPASRLRALAADASNRPAAITATETLDYAGLLERCEQAAARLIQRGAGRGKVVAIQLTRPVDLMIAYCAVSLAGAVLCVRPAGLSTKTQKTYLANVAAIGQFAELTGKLNQVDAEEDDKAASVASDPLAILFAGPGATRAVLHNSHTLLAGMEEMAAKLALSFGDRLTIGNGVDEVTTLAAVNLALVSGAAVDDSADNATVVFCADAAPRAPGGNLRLVIGTGSDLIAEEAVLGGTLVCHARCAAESQLMFASGPRDDAAIRHNTVGLPNPAMSARVVTEDGEVLKTGTAGMLEVRGANLAPSYLDDAKANRTAFTGDRWLRTGLCGVINSDGSIGLLADDN